MRRFVLTALLLALTTACSPTRAAPTDGTATVVTVTDGDTVDVDFGGGVVEPVRLLGIDTSNLANLHPVWPLPHNHGCRSGPTRASYAV